MQRILNWVGWTLLLTSVIIGLLNLGDYKYTPVDHDSKRRTLELIKPLDPPKVVEMATKPKIAVKPVQAPVVAPSGTCADWMTQAGITDWDNAIWLINKESGCRPNAINPSSGACGIAQSLPCAKMGCSLQDPVCQLKWMQGYVFARYSSWENAVKFHLLHNWY